jgi:hypothetical protein
MTGRTYMVLALTIIGLVAVETEVHAAPADSDSKPVVRG